MTKAELMRKIQELAFAKTETELYLDTHPDNTMALEYYAKINAELMEYAMQYTNKYGPIVAGESMGETWSWVKNPWPWHIDFETEDAQRVDL